MPFTVAEASRFCQLRALASCRRNIRCQSLSESDLLGCVERTEDGCDQGALTAAADAGRLVFDEPIALECLNGFSTGSCTEDPPSCARVTRGRVPPDGGCVTAAECGAGAFCDLFGATCPFRCVAYRTLGDRCDFFRPCDPNFACFRGDGGTEETCQPVTPLDAPCLDFDECGSEGACVRGTCTARRSDAGGVCGIRSGYPFCDPEYFCRQEAPPRQGDDPPPGTCQRRTGLGGVCAGAGTCLPSLRCSAVVTTGTCLAKASRGASCSTFSDCEEGLYCSTATQRCEAFPGDGGDCSFTAGSQGRCQPRHFCDFEAGSERRCQPKRASGAPCSYDQMCLSNECEFGRRPDGGFGGLCGLACSLKADAGL
jgi:hypothetical protein